MSDPLSDASALHEDVIAVAVAVAVAVGVVVVVVLPRVFRHVIDIHCHVLFPYL